MADQSRELNHVINMMYRQLGKELFDDLKKDQVNIRKYRSRSRRIENVIKALRSLEINMDSVEDEDMKVIKAPEKDADGLYQYVFCNVCNAGNNPEATHCIRCGSDLEQ